MLLQRKFPSDFRRVTTRPLLSELPVRTGPPARLRTERGNRERKNRPERVNTYQPQGRKGNTKPPLQLRNFRVTSVATHSPALVACLALVALREVFGYGDAKRACGETALSCVKGRALRARGRSLVRAFLSYARHGSLRTSRACGAAPCFPSELNSSILVTEETSPVLQRTRGRVEREERADAGRKSWPPERRASNRAGA
jgi:hypothetical protein